MKCIHCNKQLVNYQGWHDKASRLVCPTGCDKDIKVSSNRINTQVMKYVTNSVSINYNVFTDVTTNIMWFGGFGPVNFDIVETDNTNINTKHWTKFDNWRLPTIKELMTVDTLNINEKSMLNSEEYCYNLEGIFWSTEITSSDCICYTFTKFGTGYTTIAKKDTEHYYYFIRENL